MFGKKNKKIHYLFKTTIVNVDNMDEPWYNACTKCNKKVVLKNQIVSAQNVATPMQIIVQGNILHSC